MPVPQLWQIQFIKMHEKRIKRMDGFSKKRSFLSTLIQGISKAVEISNAHHSKFDRFVQLPL